MLPEPRSGLSDRSIDVAQTPTLATGLVADLGAWGEDAEMRAMLGGRLEDEQVSTPAGRWLAAWRGQSLGSVSEVSPVVADCIQLWADPSPERLARLQVSLGLPQRLGWLIELGLRLDNLERLETLDEAGFRSELGALSEHSTLLEQLGRLFPLLQCRTQRERARLEALGGRFQVARGFLEEALHLAERFEIWPEHACALQAQERLDGGEAVGGMGRNVGTLAERARRMSRFLQYFPELLASESTDQLIERTIVLSAQVLQCARVGWFFDGVLLRSWPPGASDFSPSLVERCVHQQQVLIESDLTSAIAFPVRTFRAAYARLEQASLWIQGRTVVVVGVGRAAVPFGSEEANLARLIAKVAGSTMIRLKAEAEALLADNEERSLRAAFDEMFEECPVAAAWVSQDLESVSPNPAFERLWQSTDGFASAIWEEDQPTFQLWWSSLAETPFRARLNGVAECPRWVLLQCHQFGSQHPRLVLVKDESAGQGAALLQLLESQRRWLAIDLHDQVAQDCAGLSFLAQSESEPRLGLECVRWAESCRRLIDELRASPALNLVEAKTTGGPPLSSLEGSLLGQVLDQVAHPDLTSLRIRLTDDFIQASLLGEVERPLLHLQVVDGWSEQHGPELQLGLPRLREAGSL